MSRKIVFEKGHISFILSAKNTRLFLSDVWVDKSCRGKNLARTEITKLLEKYPKVASLTLIPTTGSRKYWLHQGFHNPNKKVKSWLTATKEEFLNQTR